MRIGLTGGIGSGKSAVAHALQALGATVIDADAISRSLTAAGGAAIPALKEAFGPASIGPDGALDRDWMRREVFERPPQRLLLENILHPLIGQEMSRQQARAEAGAPGLPVVFDIPLLVESGRWPARVDLVLVVDCEESTQVQRVMSRSGWSREQVLKVMQQQATRVRRRACADDILYNDGASLQALNAQVRQWWTLRVGPIPGEDGP